MRYLLSLLFVLQNLLSANAQTAQLKISTKPNSLFFLVVDGNLLAKQSKTAFFSDKLKPGEHRIDLFSDSSYKRFSFSINLNANTKHDFEINLSVKNPQLLPIAESELINGYEENKVLVKGKKQEIINPVTLGELQVNLSLDSLVLKSDLNNYIGSSACNTPLNPSLFNTLLNQFEKLTFEFERMEFFNEKIKSKCLKSNQLSMFLQHFEFDDTKLSLLESCSKNIFDIDNLTLLKTQFQLSASDEKLRLFIEKLKTQNN